MPADPKRTAEPKRTINANVRSGVHWRAVAV
ncbi:hypothetical protein PJE062_4999 [Pseudovibrio sp. JE062]|nr:hypothetical protein PJE062_4999 [Pseudovibrio sp. JE062]